jgi:hypothetical protein
MHFTYTYLDSQLTPLLLMVLNVLPFVRGVDLTLLPKNVQLRRPADTPTSNAWTRFAWRLRSSAERVDPGASIYL